MKLGYKVIIVKSKDLRNEFNFLEVHEGKNYSGSHAK